MADMTEPRRGEGNPAPATRKSKARPCAGFFLSAIRPFNVRFTAETGHWAKLGLKGRL